MNHSISSTNGSEESPTGDQETTPAVSVDGLRKQYGSDDNAVTAVDGISFHVEPGTAVGILGPNGAGKTTTIKSLLGLIVPTQGTVHINGVNVHRNPEVTYRQVGAMLEGARNTYWRLTVRENLRFFAALAGQSPRRMAGRHEELLDMFDLREKADTAVRELSRGQKQKVSLANTLARDSDVVFLDEPTLGLDIESSLDLRTELRNLVTEQGTTILLSSHDMDVIEDVCDRVIVMNDGSVITDEPVDQLLDVFEVQSYEVVVKGNVSSRLRADLEEKFDASGFDARNGSTKFSVRVGSDEFYRFVDVLRSNDCTVESFSAVEPDLEDVFLELTDRSTSTVEPASRPLIDQGGSQ